MRLQRQKVKKIIDVLVKPLYIASVVETLLATFCIVIGFAKSDFGDFMIWFPLATFFCWVTYYIFKMIQKKLKD